MDSGRGSLFKLCGQARSNFRIRAPVWRGHDAGVGTAFTAYMCSHAGHPWSCRRRRQLDHWGSWVGKVQTKQVGRRQPLWLTRHRSSCCNVICVCWRRCGG